MKMEKYVKLEDVVKLILEEGLYCDTQADREYSAEYVRQLPTFSELVEVIRCRDCKHWNKCVVSGEWPDKVTCACKIVQHFTQKGWRRYTAPDDYCSFAERDDSSD